MGVLPECMFAYHMQAWNQSRSPEASMQVQVGWEASSWPILPKVSSAWGFLFWVFLFLGQKLCVSHLVLQTIFRGRECATPAVM